MPSLYDNLLYNVGGGIDQATLNLQAQQQAAEMELARQNTGFQLLDYLTSLQQNPFSIVPALQAYGAAGGGTLASANAFAQSGGIGQPSPYGAIAQQLIQGLSEFTGGTPINPNTGRPFTPTEMAYLRVFAANQQKKEQGGLQPGDIKTGSTKNPDTGFTIPDNKQSDNKQGTTTQVRNNMGGDTEVNIQSLVDQIRKVRGGSSTKRARTYVEPKLVLA